MNAPLVDVLDYINHYSINDCTATLEAYSLSECGGSYLFTCNQNEERHDILIRAKGSVGYQIKVRDILRVEGLEAIEFKYYVPFSDGHYECISTIDYDLQYYVRNN